MSRTPPSAEKLQVGCLYRDIDGSLVHLLAVQDNICCWTPLGCGSDAAQMTHRDNFLRRFVAWRPVSRRAQAAKRKQSTSPPDGVIPTKKVA